MSQHERVTDFPLLGNIGAMRFFGGFKVAKEMSFAFVADHGHVFGSALADPKYSSFTVRPDASDVADVFLVRDSSQVAEPVIIPDAINVINEALGKFTRLVKPSKPMGFVWRIINVDVDVARDVLVARHSSLQAFSSALKASKNAGLRIVVQKLFQALLRQGIVHLSHVITPSQRWIGQRIEGVTSTFFPRHSIQGVA